MEAKRWRHLRENRGPSRLWGLVIFCAIVLGILLLNHAAHSSVYLGFSVYGITTLSFLLMKILVSAWYVPCRDEVDSHLKVAVVVPVFNEDPEVFARCLQSLLGQTRPLDEIYVIDDGSGDASCVAVALLELRERGAFVQKLARNQGKRHAQSLGFKKSHADIIVTVDSDSVLDPDAVREGLRPFSDPRIQGVCGQVLVLNNRKNLLTRLIDLRYGNSFLYERAAYTVLDSILCSAGVLSFWRADTVRSHLEDYTNQSFLGVHVGYGDDRRMTNYALLRGRVVFQETSKAWTVVPEKLPQFLKQQNRWNKSFFRETLFTLTHLPMKRPAWWMCLGEILLWAFFTVNITMAAIRPLLGGAGLGLFYFGYMALMAYGRNVRFARADLAAFVLAPVYGLLHLFLLTPLRLYSLFSLRNGAWGTRGPGIPPTPTHLNLPR